MKYSCGNECKVGDLLQRKGGVSYYLVSRVDSDSIQYQEAHSKEGSSFPGNPKYYVLIARNCKPNPHIDKIIAYSVGAEIEYQAPSGIWWPASTPDWSKTARYRIKPLPPLLSPMELEKQSILAEMEKLKERLDKLEVNNHE